MRMMRLMTVGILGWALGGCDAQPAGEPQADGLAAVFVAGHLGSYRDCPDEAYGASDRAARPDGDAIIDADCAEEECGLLNCEAARLTLSLRNEGERDAEGIDVIGVFVLDAAGASVAALPVVAVTVEGQPFDGALAAGTEALVDVEFVGPLAVDALTGADGDGLLGRPNGAPLRILLVSESHGELSLDTVAIYSLPEVDT
ncbi:MAG: hypothetical protein H6703_12715 [Myxococcales bacterium]|nr:hypothetical protein [Myxococcales bacterium]